MQIHFALYCVKYSEDVYTEIIYLAVLLLKAVYR